MSVDARPATRTFEPARLAMARRLAGLRQWELAAAIDRPVAAVAQYELGRSYPSAETLARCARVLDVPAGFFTAGRPQLRLDTAQVHFRSLRATQTVRREQALARVELLWELLGEVEQVVELPTVDLGLPPGAGPGDPARVAREVRGVWGVSAGPVAHLVRNLEARGVVVVENPPTADPTGQDVDAFSAPLYGRPVVVLPATEDLAERRFAAAHELGHLLLHPDAAPGNGHHEAEAIAFAAEFLAPARELRDLLPPATDVPALVELGTSYGVPVTVLVRQGRNLGVYPADVCRRLMSALATLDQRAHRPPVTYPGERPELVVRALDMAADHGLPLGALARRLRVTPAMVRDLLGLGVNRPRLRLVSGG